MSGSGFYTLEFTGTGPTIDGYTATEVSIGYNLGVNPFTATEQLSDLLLSSTIEDLGIFVSGDTIGASGALETDVSGSVTPEPATFCLLGLGGLVLRRRKSA